MIMIIKEFLRNINALLSSTQRPIASEQNQQDGKEQRKREWKVRREEVGENIK